MAHRGAKIAQLAVNTSSRQFSTTPASLLPPKKGQTVKKASNSFTKKNKGGGKVKTEAVSNSGRYEKLQGPPPDLTFMPEFLPERLTAQSVGSAFRFTKDNLSLVKHTGIPPGIAREFALEREAHSVLRASTLSLIDKLDLAAKESSGRHRYVLHGEGGSGRSVSLLQSVIYAQQSDWLVWYIPKSQHLVDSSFDYIPPAPGTQTWSQPALSAHLLKTFAESNKSKLTKMKISEDCAGVKAGDSLYALCLHASAQESAAVEVFEGVFKQLNTQTTYPVLLAMDSVQALFQPTLYRDQHFNKLQPYDLSVTAKLLELISGRQQLKKGAIVTATSSTPTSMQIPPVLLAQLGLQPKTPINPLKKWNTKHLDNSNGLQLVDMKSLTFAEAVGVFESLGKTLGISYPMSDELLLAKFTEAGGSPKVFTNSLRSMM